MEALRRPAQPLGPLLSPPYCAQAPARAGRLPQLYAEDPGVLLTAMNRQVRLKTVMAAERGKDHQGLAVHKIKPALHRQSAQDRMKL